MKPLFKSSETFTAYATIDACYYTLQKMFADMEARAPIDKAIDKATGREADFANDIADVVRTMIKNKKLIGADYSADEELLNKITACPNK